jgi:hypothetical protein
MPLFCLARPSAPIGHTLMRRLERRIKRGKFTRMLCERGMNFVHAFTLLAIAGESAESNFVALGRELFSFGDVLRPLGFKFANQGRSFFKFRRHEKFLFLNSANVD